MERLGLLDERVVSRVADDDLAYAWNRGGDLPGAQRPTDEVVLSGDDKRRCSDPWQAASQVVVLTVVLFVWLLSSVAAGTM